MHRILISLMILGSLIVGCSSGELPPTEEPAVTAPATLPAAAPTPTTMDAPTLAPEPPPARMEICSPLAGVGIDRLSGMIVNPYHPPKLGSDEPHQGVDLANLSAPGGIALAGMTVQAMISGKAAGIANDRFPYGNMLMIETPLDEPLFQALPELIVPAPLPALLPSGALTCPELMVKPAVEGEPRSLYILYAHMQNPPAVKQGDEISCGQQIGAIGSSGNALNPHLHVEARVGPSGQTFASMAHYDPSADEVEMAAYCTWRVSGVFQTIDPGCLWGDCANQ